MIERFVRTENYNKQQLKVRKHLTTFNLKKNFYKGLTFQSFVANEMEIFNKMLCKMSETIQ